MHKLKIGSSSELSGGQAFFTVYIIAIHVSVSLLLVFFHAVQPSSGHTLYWSHVNFILFSAFTKGKVDAEGYTPNEAVVPLHVG